MKSPGSTPLNTALNAIPSDPLSPSPHRNLCTDCGVSRTAEPQR